MKTQILKLNFVLLAYASILLASCGHDGPFRGDCINGQGGIVTQELSVADFTSLSTTGSFNIEIIEADEQKITATGHANIISLLNTEVSGSDYHLGLRSGCYRNFDLEVTIETPYLDQISSNGSGNVFIRSLAETESLAIATTGSGLVRSSSTLSAEGWVFLESTGSGGMILSIETDSLHVSQTGSGNMELSGELRTQDIVKTGSGSYFAYDLVSEITTLVNSGSGLTQLDVRDELRAYLNGSGSVFYRGRPSVVIANAVGSGTVVSAD